MAKLPSEPAPFTGFGPRALDFFKALAFHQDKAWFEENRPIYEAEVRRPMEALLATLSRRFAESGPPLRGDARSIFRLHRDVRFSKDKRPYKTNGGAVLSPDGTKRTQGFLYLHLDPEGCFAASGFWQPQPEELAALRRAVVARPQEMRAVVGRLGRAGLTLGDGDPLARLPKGFEDVADAGIAAIVRMRNLIVRRPIADAALAAPDLADALLAFGREAGPLLRFGWQALGRAA